MLLMIRYISTNKKMVKNTGGNKSKKVARKNASGNNNGQEVRRVNDPCEMYAAVTKIYSSRRCDVLGSDGNTYSCTVRGKFLKSKRTGDGALGIGVWVIIGFYDWEVRGDGSKNCDLLEIYTQLEKEKLKQLEARHLKAILSVGELAGSENEFTFSNFKMDEGKESSSENEEEALQKNGEDGKDGETFVMAMPVPVPIQPARKKETLQEQMDWLTIDVKDI